MHTSKKRSMWWMLLPVILICAPLVAIAANYMAFKIGFFIGGSALAAIIASGFAFVIFPDRLQGAHASNMGQTAASACGSLSGIIAVLLQAFYWIGVGEDFDFTGMVLFIATSSMFGVGIGMLQTPLLVDKMALKYPTGFSVYKILVALMSPEQLRRAFTWLFGGILGGITTTLNPHKLLAKNHFDAGVFGAGLVVGPAVTIPALLGGTIGLYLTPTLLELGWLDDSHPTFRHVAFFAGLAMIFGAALVDVSIITYQGLKVYRAAQQESNNVLPRWVIGWTAIWGLLAVICGTTMLDISVVYLLMAVGLSFVFVLVNGLSTGIADANPVTGAFVLTILLMTFIAGVSDTATALMAGTMVLVTIAVGVDMQQDRSTGRRLGSDRTKQFWFQVPGVIMGIAAGFILGPYFLENSPELKIQSDILAKQDPELAKQWSSAFTMKIVGALKMIKGYQGHELILLGIGLVLGIGMQAARRRWSGVLQRSSILNTLLLPSPYAIAFATFVPFVYTVWFGFGGICKGVIDWLSQVKEDDDEVLDHSAVDSSEDEAKPLGIPPLLGGGMIAGAGIAYLWIAGGSTVTSFLADPPWWAFVVTVITLLLLTIWQVKKKPSEGEAN